MNILLKYHKAKKIFKSDIPWEDKYDQIFALCSGIDIGDYYDPDTTYEEDITAFMNQFDKFIETYEPEQSHSCMISIEFLNANNLPGLIEAVKTMVAKELLSIRDSACYPFSMVSETENIKIEIV